MGSLDYLFVEDLRQFGRGLAAEMLGQPFIVYRLNTTSSELVIAGENQILSDFRAKITRTRQTKFVENEYMHVNPFEFLADSSKVQLGDVLMQNDQVYGGNAAYTVASKRPQKPLVCVRTESLAMIWRPDGGEASGYSAPTAAKRLPFVLNNGVFSLGTTADQAHPAVIPVGVQSIGQMKGLKPERLPMDTVTSWWFIYVPNFPGLTRLRDGDIIEQISLDSAEKSRRFRINIEYTSPVGLEGHFLSAERILP